jgi:hypothetical protein
MPASAQDTSRFRYLATAGYLVAFALLLIPILDAIFGVVPIRLGDLRWRFTAFGLVSNVAMTSLTGLLLAFFLSAFLQHRLLQRILGGLALFGAVIAAGAVVLFVLDAIQLYRDVRTDAQGAFRIASARAAIKMTLACVTLVFFAIAAYRAWPRRSRRRAEQGVLLVGSSYAGAAAPPAPGEAATPQGTGEGSRNAAT